MGRRNFSSALEFGIWLQGGGLSPAALSGIQTSGRKAPALQSRIQNPDSIVRLESRTSGT